MRRPFLYPPPFLFAVIVVLLNNFFKKLLGVIVNYLGLEEKNKIGIHFLHSMYVFFYSFKGKEMKDKSRMEDRL